MPLTSIVVPNRNEAGDVAELVRRLDAALGTLRAEIIFVDDSDDDTPEVIRRTAAATERDVRLLHREPGRRDGRLGGAVVAGFQVARAPWAVVIDGDLQHPRSPSPRCCRESPPKWIWSTAPGTRVPRGQRPDERVFPARVVW